MRSYFVLTILVLSLFFASAVLLWAPEWGSEDQIDIPAQSWEAETILPWAVHMPAKPGIAKLDRSGPPAMPAAGPGDTLLWDDGLTYTYLYYFSAGDGCGVEFEPYYYPCRVKSVLMWFNAGWPTPGGDDLIVMILDDNGVDGAPGTILYADTLNNVAQLGVWNEIAIGDTGVVIEDGTFYGVYLQAEDGPNCPSIAFDYGYETNHGWAFYEGTWSPSTTWGDMLLRAVVERAGGDAHDAGVKSILQPGKVYDPASPMVPSAVVKNYGTFVESFDVNCTITSEGSETYNQNVAVNSLGPDTGAEVQFPSYTVTAGNAYRLEFTTLLDPDNTAMNDQKGTITRHYTQSRRTVLLEGATGTWCFYCQDGAIGLDSLRKVAGDSVAIVEYHNNDEFVNAASDSRIAYYNITSYPTVVFDGVERVVGSSEYMYNSYRYKANSQFEKKIPVSIMLYGNYDNPTRTGYVQVDIDAVNGIAADDLRLYAVLTESHIAHTWFDQDSLQFVAREMFPDINGVPLALGKGDSHVEMINFQVSQDFVDSNCEMVVFLQDLPTGEVLGARTSRLNDLMPLSVTEPVGDTWLPRTFQLMQNYPNPFNPLTRINYVVPPGSSKEVELSIYSVRGIRLLTLVSAVKGPGEYSVMWDGKDSQGRDAGSGAYFYRLRVGDDERVAKMLLVR